jgi:tungstate transport system substrate-binding protein
MATTTSVENSGLLDAILPAFERQSGLHVEVLAVGSGQALNLLQRGEVAVALTHDPAAEASALASGIIAGYRKIMFNDFIIVGPADDPARIMGASTAADALLRIAAGNALFVSRGDASGTYSREQELWSRAGQRPSHDRLLETGQGMGATLRVASERGAYTLADRATFEQVRARLRLVSLFEGGPELLNTYAIFIGAAVHGSERAAALTVTQWFADGAGRPLIAGFVANGQRVFKVWPAGAARERPADLPSVDLANAH